MVLYLPRMSNIYRIGEPNAYFDKFQISNREPNQNWVHLNRNHAQSNVDQIQNLISRSGSMVLIMGRSGSGKSYMIRHLVEKLTPKKNVAVVAPTGTSAMQVGGSTIHSLFRFPSDAF